MAKRKRKKRPARLEPLLDWKRARRDETELDDRRIFESRCREYWVIESVGKFNEMGTVWFAIANHPREKYQTLISRHRRRAPAERACETHNRANNNHN